MKRLVLSMLTLFLLNSCTYNVSMAHTSGTATDAINDTLTNTPDVSPNVTIPLTPSASLKVSK